MLPSFEFCELLLTGGVARAESPVESNSDETRINNLIAQVDQAARLEAPSQAPPLDLHAAKWALTTVAWSALLLVDRSNRDTNLPIVLVDAEPTGHEACHHWSTDLAFRFLAGIMTRVNLASSDDPLSQTLQELASRWPLACIGTNVCWSADFGRVVIGDNRGLVVVSR